MGRFGWLEMDSELPGGDPVATAGQRDLDEVMCLERATKLLRQGQYETALQWFSRALRFQLDLEDAWAGQVQCLLALGEYPEANIWADRALERFQDSPDILAAKALAVDRTRGYGAAMAYSDASLSVKGRVVGPYPWIVRGDLLLDTRESRQAANRCFDKALELAGRDWYTHYLIGLTWMQKDCFDQALVRLSAGNKLETHNPLLLCGMGECRERRGEVREAISAYRRAREADPTCRYAKDRLEALKHIGLLRRLFRALRRRG